METRAALTATVDRREHARYLSGVHDAMAQGSWSTDGAPTTTLVRPVIARSWQRSLSHGVEPGGLPSAGRLALTADELSRRRERHPLTIAPDVMARGFAGIDDPNHLIFVADADGSLLWLEGRPATVDTVNQAGVFVGRRLSEDTTGTSALATSLVEGTPVQIFASEHFQVEFHGLGCSAAPVRDPFSGDIIGAVGVSGGYADTHPHSLGLVSLAARAIEHQLVADAHTTAARLLGMPEASLTVLGRERGVVRSGSRVIELSRRHTEMLLLMWLAPDGLSAERMAGEIYGPRGRPGTVRVEMHRLRAILGDLIGERPYRLLGRLSCDLEHADRLITKDDLTRAVRGNQGSTLASTVVPRLVELRDTIDDHIRTGVLRSGDVELLEGWLRTPAGRDDAEASRNLMARLHRDDPRRAAERSRLRRLMAGESGAESA